MPRLSDYGMSKQDFADLLEHQRGTCTGCGKRFTRSRPACVDHDHRTGEVRGLLCNFCNGLLGVIHDNTDLLHGLWQYLDSPPAWQVFDHPRLHKDAPPRKAQVVAPYIRKETANYLRSKAACLECDNPEVAEAYYEAAEEVEQS